jgi:hypothetical protein
MGAHSNLFQYAIRLAWQSFHPPLFPIVNILGRQSLSRMSALVLSLGHPFETYVVFLLWIDLPLVRSQTQCLVLRHLPHLFIMSFITQSRGWRQEEASSNHDSDEGKAEQEEGMFLHRGPI